jgi:hypothetical protein
MLTIVDGNATQTSVMAPSRAYAEAAWAANPALAPNWWRENLGETHSKFAYDGRMIAAAPRVLGQGVNLLLATPATRPAQLPAGVVVVLATANTQAVADYLLLPLMGLDEPALIAAFQELESRVAHGTLQAYGVVADDLGTPTPGWPLHRLLGLAATAAESTWGRKKRPSLRIVLAPLDMLEWGLLFTSNTQHKTEAVSALELAARLSLMVLVQPHAVPETVADTAALQALTKVAEAEVALHHTLQGQWPHVAGQPVFSVLKLLESGQPPWPTPAVAQQWQQIIWPSLQAALHALPAATPLQAAWSELYPYVREIAHAAAAPLVQRALQQLPWPAPWAELPPTLQQLALLASVPGVGAVVVPPNTDLASLHALPDLPDIGALLA